MVLSVSDWCWQPGPLCNVTFWPADSADSAITAHVHIVFRIDWFLGWIRHFLKVFTTNLMKNTSKISEVFFKLKTNIQIYSCSDIPLKNNHHETFFTTWKYKEFLMIHDTSKCSEAVDRIMSMCTYMCYSLQTPPAPTIWLSVCNDPPASLGARLVAVGGADIKTKRPINATSSIQILCG